MSSRDVTPDRPAPPARRPWDGYVTGPETDLARAGVLALARGDAAGASPMVVHGPSGAGKSRLLRELVAEWLDRRPGASVALLESETFAAACAEAASRRGGWADLRGDLRSVDLFVLDDLPALARAPMALAELVQTLDALADAGAAVAVSARTAPGHWSGLPARLVSRLVGGLAVGVDPPGLAARRRYLLDRAAAAGVRLPADSVDALAEAADGYRTIDGWLARRAVAARVARRPVDAGSVRRLLDGDAEGAVDLSGAGAPIPPEARAWILDRVARDVARRFGVSLRDLRGPSRRAVVAGPRHLAMRLARDRGLSIRAIGAYFGGRDPATVRHALRAAADRVAADPGLAGALEPLGPPRPAPNA